MKTKTHITNLFTRLLFGIGAATGAQILLFLLIFILMFLLYLITALLSPSDAIEGGRIFLHYYWDDIFMTYVVDYKFPLIVGIMTFCSVPKFKHE